MKRALLIVPALLLAIAIPAFAQTTSAPAPLTLSLQPGASVNLVGDGCVLEASGQAITCLTPTPIPSPTPRATSTPAPTATPLVVAALSAGTNHAQPYDMPAGWTEPIDAYVVSATQRRVDVTLLVQDARGLSLWTDTQSVLLNPGSTAVQSSWTVPLTQPPDLYYASLRVIDPTTGVDLIPLTQMFSFRTSAAR